MVIALCQLMRRLAILLVSLSTACATAKYEPELGPDQQDDGPADDLGSGPDAGATGGGGDSGSQGPGYCDVEVEQAAGTRTVYNHDDLGRLLTTTTYYSSSTSASEFQWSEDGLTVVESKEYGSTYTRYYEELPSGLRIKTFLLGSYRVEFDYGAAGELRSAITYDATGEVTRTRTFTSDGTRIASVRTTSSIQNSLERYYYGSNGLIRRDYHSDYAGPATYRVSLIRDSSGKLIRIEDDNQVDGTIDDVEVLRYDGPGCDAVGEGWWFTGYPGLEQ